MKRSSGFLLIEVLVASGVLATAFLAMAQSIAIAGTASRRAAIMSGTAECAEGKLAETLIGRAGFSFECDPLLVVDVETSLRDGNTEDVIWRISAPGRAPETFSAARYAR